MYLQALRCFMIKFNFKNKIKKKKKSHNYPQNYKIYCLMLWRKEEKKM